MLRKENRIRKQSEFDAIFKAHKKIRSDNFQILVRFVSGNQQTIHKKHMTYPRFAFVVSKKVGNAPVRNSVKRRLREIVRAELPNLKTSFEAIVVTYPQIHDKEYKVLQEEVRESLKSGDLYISE